MTLSNKESIAGKMSITTIVLIIEPLESKVQIAFIISIFEETVTPNVDANKLMPLIRIDFIDVLWAMEIASFLLN